MSVLGSIREAATGRKGASGPSVERETRRADAAETMAEVYEESLNILEDRLLDDEGWRRVGIESEREFTRRGLIEMIKISRAMYLSHPLIQRAVNVTSYYTWAQGSTTQAQDTKIQEEIVEPTMEDDGNRAEWFGYQNRLLTDVDQMVEGNIFFILFTNLYGDVSVRSVPTQQITEILTREGDGRIITYYRRVWGEVTLNAATGATDQVEHEEFYPDWRYHPDKKPQMIGGIKVNWDAPIMHQRTGGLKNMRFGVPETFSSLDWARAYKNFLEDWHTLVKSLSRFAFKATTKGKKIKGLKEKLEKEGKDGVGDEPLEQAPTERLGRGKRIGDVFVGRENDDIQAIPKSGATISSDDARPSRLMIAAAMDLPDTILSQDPQQGALATAKTLDRPTELRMKSRQTMWTSCEQDFWRYCIDSKVRAGQLSGKQVKDPRTDLNVIVPAGNASVDVTFPPILEDDPLANIHAIVAAATLEGKPDANVLPPEQVAKMLLEALGADDIDQLMEELPEEEEETEPGEEDEELTRGKVEEALAALTEAIRAANA